jgi:hypothetical protein
MPVSAQTMQDLFGGVASDGIGIRNPSSGLVIFEDPKNSISIEWAAAGDPDGGDIQQVDISLLKHAQFRKIIAQGVLVVESDDEALNEAMQAAATAWTDAQRRRGDSVNDLINRNRDTVGKTTGCIAPKRDTESGLCGTPCLVSTDKPPLCAEHANQAVHYSPYETGEFDRVTLKNTVAWRRVELQKN